MHRHLSFGLQPGCFPVKRGSIIFFSKPKYGELTFKYTRDNNHMPLKQTPQSRLSMFKCPIMKLTIETVRNATKGKGYGTSLIAQQAT